MIVFFGLVCFIGFWLLCSDLLFGTRPRDCEIGFYCVRRVLCSALNKRQFKCMTESYQSCTQLLAIHKSFIIYVVLCHSKKAVREQGTKDIEYFLFPIWWIRSFLIYNSGPSPTVWLSRIRFSVTGSQFLLISSCYPNQMKSCFRFSSFMVQSLFIFYIILFL